MREIRDLANRFDANSIESCIQLAMENKKNPCYTTGETEEVISVLAKTSFVQTLMQQGLSIAEAVRELGKRIRKIQL